MGYVEDIDNLCTEIEEALSRVPVVRAINEAKMKNHFFLAFPLFRDKRPGMGDRAGRTQITSRNMSPAIAQIGRGVLQGVQGIGDDGNVMAEWLGLGARNALLSMPKAATLRANPGLIEMDYRDPELLMANDGQILKRLTNEFRGRSFWESNLPTKMFSSHIARAVDGRYLQLAFSEIGSYLESYWKKHGNPKVNSVGDLVDAFYKWALDSMEKPAEFPYMPWGLRGYFRDDARETFSRADVRKWFATGIVNQAKLWEDEGEWILTGDTLRIPRQSILYILDQNPQRHLPAETEAIKRAQAMPFKDLKAVHKQATTTPMGPRALAMARSIEHDLKKPVMGLRWPLEYTLHHRLMLRALDRAGVRQRVRVKIGVDKGRWERAQPLMRQRQSRGR